MSKFKDFVICRCFVLGVSIGKADCVQINLNPEAGRGERSE